MNDNDFSMFEDRAYLSPTVSRDEQLSFIDTLRNTQAQNTQQINADTYALGSQLPSNLGGLSGAEDTFVARYQKPQTEQTVADLRTAAQQTALNQALSNLQSAYRKRYNDAILNYQKRSAAAATTPNTPSNTPDTAGDNGLQIDTNGGSSGSQSLVPDPFDINNLPSDVTSSEVSGSSIGGGEFDPRTAWDKLLGGATPYGTTAVPFRYTSNGRDYAAILYRDANTGAVQGVSTESGDYKANSGEQFIQNIIQSGESIKNRNGEVMNDFWRLQLW